MCQLPRVCHQHLAYVVDKVRLRNVHTRCILRAQDRNNRKTTSGPMKISNTEGVIFDLPEVLLNMHLGAHLELHYHNDTRGEKHCVRPPAETPKRVLEQDAPAIRGWQLGN